MKTGLQLEKDDVPIFKELEKEVSRPRWRKTTRCTTGLTGAGKQLLWLLVSCLALYRFALPWDHTNNQIVWLMRSFGNWTSRDRETVFCLWPPRSTILSVKSYSTRKPSPIRGPSCQGALVSLNPSAIPEDTAPMWQVKEDIKHHSTVMPAS